MSLHFTTIPFYTFFIGVLFSSLILHRWKMLWKIFMLIVSLLFYWSFVGKFVWILIYAIVCNYILAQLIRKKLLHEKLLIVLGIFINVFTLFLFKYYDLLVDTFQQYSYGHFLPTLGILAPIGISFWIFRLLSYLIDSKREKIIAEHSFLDFALYVTFFPQILSGPLMRANDFFEQLNSHTTHISKIDGQRYMIRFLIGLVKKLLIATYLFESVVNPIFSVPENYSWIFLWIAMYAYSIYIYADFSGYTDMSNAVSGLIGFKSPENFNSPYSATSVSDFWKRWHISLSEWMRDYVYISLGGNRAGRFRELVNIFVTMLISGIWHGAGICFVIWGAYHGLFMVIERMLKWIGVKLFGENLYKENNAIKYLKIFFTFHVISLGWLIFNSIDISYFQEYISRMIDFKPLTDLKIDANVIIVLIVGIVLHYAGNRMVEKLAAKTCHLRLFLRIILWTTLLLSITFLGPQTTPGFIYYQF